jgi:type II secretory ATPase GspE/PulE/Tfp pilus assembly ATPase PilB-like protein
MINDEKLRQNLSESNIVKKEALDAAWENAKKNNLSLSDALLDKDLISDENLGKIIADELGFPYVNLLTSNIQTELLSLIPQKLSKARKIFVFKKDDKNVYLATPNPEDYETISFIEKKIKIPAIVYYTTKRNINEAQKFYNLGIETDFKKILLANAQEAKETEQEAPIIRLTDTILRYADENKASDVHIEPKKNVTLIRFRMDGVLRDMATLPKEIHQQIVTRIKVMSGLRTDEHQAAQDGKLSIELERETVDVRVSIIPVTGGENIVMRLLPEKDRQFGLTDLGMDEFDLAKITGAMNKPYGMILATGPTGSGKTTTQYSILKLLDKREVNIMTIEDPVEYELEGVNQIQVNPRTNLTFADGLRSIVRQDPDIILVGEIRDEETAGIAINSAMTGHLVLSTLHTNDAATTLPRLLDMKVEPFLVASTINIIIGQRLVRRICLKCIESAPYKISTLKKQFSAEIIEKYFSKSATEVRLYQSKGCEACHYTGYSGRIGIYEVMEMQENIKAAVMDRKNASFIKELAIKNGMTPMIEDGIKKALKGMTTIDEVIRVISS